MYKIVFFVPETHLDAVKEAMFTAGAGTIGNYDRCSWQVLGLGQFRPLPGAEPHIGEVESVTQVPEYRVEMICAAAHARAAVAALQAAHPYEEPAFDVMPLLDPQVL